MMYRIQYLNGIAALVLLGFLAAAACSGSEKKGEQSRAGKPAVESPSSATARSSEPVTELAATVPEESATSAVEPEREVTFEEAESAFGDRRYDEASEMFASYAERRPENPWGHYMLGLSEWKAGRDGEAESAFERALELNPDHVKSLSNLSRVLLDESRPEDALTRVERLIELDPGSAVGYRLLGRVRSELGQAGAAIDAYERAITLDDRDVWSMNNLGLLYIRQGCFEDALGPLARATELAPEVPIFQNNLGIALERTGHYVAATEAYRAALAVDSTYEKASVSLARVEGREESPDTQPVELASLSRRFQEEVARWRGTGGGEDTVPDTMPPTEDGTGRSRPESGASR